MIYARYADSLFLDPVLNDANVDIWVLTNLYDTLLAPTRDGLGVQPGLATKWDLSADGKTVTLALRPGVKFADGSDLTADDVTWSLDRARDPKAGAWSSSLASIDRIEAEGGPYASCSSTPTRPSSRPWQLSTPRSCRTSCSTLRRARRRRTKPRRSPRSRWAQAPSCSPPGSTGSL